MLSAKEKGNAYGQKYGSGNDSNNRLHPDHCVDLQKSGLSDVTIKESRIYTVRPGHIGKKLGWNPEGLLSVMALPYPGFDTFERYKLFYDPEYTGKTHRYLQRKNTGNHLYISEKVRPVLQDVSITLYITEGEKKALKASQEGLPCIGLSGLWNWSDGNRELLPDFDKIAFEGRNIIIVPDNDWLLPNKLGYQKNLKQAVEKLIQKLISRGAAVSIKELPCGVSGGKIGLDDYLLKNNLDAFKALPIKTIVPLIQRIQNATTDNYKGLLQDISYESPVAQDASIKRLSRVLKVSVRALKNELMKPEERKASKTNTGYKAIFPDLCKMTKPEYYGKLRDVLLNIAAQRMEDKMQSPEGGFIVSPKPPSILAVP
ncbi:MAG: DUF3854 domain-containing protein [Syntrophorhabdaceae bacterium]